MLWSMLNTSFRIFEIEEADKTRPSRPLSVLVIDNACVPNWSESREVIFEGVIVRGVRYVPDEHGGVVLILERLFFRNSTLLFRLDVLLTGLCIKVICRALIRVHY